jgi:hypothetical protein
MLGLSVGLEQYRSECGGAATRAHWLDRERAAPTRDRKPLVPVPAVGQWSNCEREKQSLVLITRGNSGGLRRKKAETVSVYMSLRRRFEPGLRMSAPFAGY